MAYKKPVYVLLISDEEPKYFQDMKSVLDYFEMACYEEGVVLEVTNVTELSLPPDPDVEQTVRNYKDLDFTL